MIALLAPSRKFVIPDSTTTPASTVAARGFSALVLRCVSGLPRDFAQPMATAMAIEAPRSEACGLPVDSIVAG